MIGRATLKLAILVWLLPLLRADDFAFLQLSDPQFGMYSENRDFAQETANFTFAIANANRLHPAFVIVCGDLVNASDNSGQKAEYLRIAGQLDKGIPLYNVAGNHDVGNQPTPAQLDAYRKQFGPDHYTFRHGAFEGIVLNSSLIQHPERAPDEAAKQEAWLRDELGKTRENGARQVVVFQHIPWFLHDADEPDQYFNIPQQTRARYLALFEQYGIRNIFAGHYHRNAEGDAAALHMTTTGPVGKPIGPDPSGIRIVWVRDTTIQSRYYGLGNVPNRIPVP